MWCFKSWAPPLVLLSILMAACGGIPGSTPVSYTAFQLTCCTQADIDQLWQPGSTVELHWTVETSRVTTTDATHNALIVVTLSGPFPDVTTLKKSHGATNILQGSIIRMDDRTAPDPVPVTTFFLPADLPTGFYKLDFKTDFGGGGSEGGESVVRVGTP